MDNASKNKKIMQVLAKKLKCEPPSFSEEMHVPCLVHVMNLVMRQGFKGLHMPLPSLDLTQQYREIEIVERSIAKLGTTSQHNSSKLGWVIEWVMKVVHLVYDSQN